jgi:hypothetical protein
MKLEFSRQILEKSSDIKFNKNRSIGTPRYTLWLIRFHLRSLFQESNWGRKSRNGCTFLTLHTSMSSFNKFYLNKLFNVLTENVLLG